MRVFIHACASAYMRACAYYVYVCMHSCVHECVRLNMCVRVHFRLSVYVWEYSCTCTHAFHSERRARVSRRAAAHGVAPRARRRRLGRVQPGGRGVSVGVCELGGVAGRSTASVDSDYGLR